MDKNKPILWLIPNALHNGYENLPHDYYSYTLPSQVQNIASRINYWLVENAKTARSFLKSLNLPLKTPIQQQNICVIASKDKELKDNFTWLKKAYNEGQDVGLLSEAGLPAIADPGSHIVAFAHLIEMQVMPLVGPCSITLALMASGFYGQSFIFHGYLPIDIKQKIKFIQNTEKQSQVLKQTQICIETPYRNTIFLQSLLDNLHSQTKLCIASELTLPTQFIKVHDIDTWKNNKNLPDILSYLNKKPCIFLWQA